MLTLLVMIALTVALGASVVGAAPPGNDATSIPAPPVGSQLPAELQRAAEALQKGDPQRAMTLARDFVKAHPDSALGHEFLAEVAVTRRQWAEAEMELNEALRLEPQRPGVLLKLGEILLQRGDARAAEARFRQALTAAPQNYVVHQRLGSALARQRKLGSALQASEEAVRLSGGRDPSAKLQLAGLYLDAGRLPDSERLLEEVVAAEPEAAQPVLLLGMTKLDLGKTDEASALFDKVASKDPKSMWVRLGRALVQRSRGNLAQARAQIEGLVKDRPDWTLAHSELARTLLMQKERDRALKAFDAAERASGDPAQERLRAARLLLAAGYRPLAIDRARPLLADPTFAPAARSVLVQAYLGERAPDQAEKILRDAVTAAPQDPVALLQLGGFYSTLGRPRDALGYFDRALGARPDDAEILTAKANTHATLGEAPEAVAAAERVVALQGDSPDARVWLGTIQHRVGRSADAMTSYQRALAKNPQHLGALRALAGLRERDGAPDEAIKLLRSAADAHPRSALPWLDLGTLYERRRQPDDAVAAYREGLRRNPDDVALLNNAAYLLAASPQTLPEAATLGERAYKKAPGIPSIADTYGWILHQQGASKRALPILEDAARRAPGNPDIQYHLGVVYARLERRAEARRALERALTTPTFRSADEARRLLDALR